MSRSSTAGFSDEERKQVKAAIATHCKPLLNLWSNTKGASTEKSFFEISLEMAALCDVFGLELEQLVNVMEHRKTQHQKSTNASIPESVRSITNFADLTKKFISLYAGLAGVNDEKKGVISEESKNSIELLLEVIPYLETLSNGEPPAPSEDDTPLESQTKKVTDSLQDLVFLLDVEQRSATVQQIDHCVVKLDLYLTQPNLKSPHKEGILFHSQNLLYDLRQFSTSTKSIMQNLLQVEDSEGEAKSKLKSEVVFRLK